MATPIVEGTLLRPFGKLLRGAIVKYDRVKAEGLRKRGILEYGRVALPDEAFLDDERVSVGHQRRRRKAEAERVDDVTEAEG